MKFYLLSALILLTVSCFSQRINQIPDTLRKPLNSDQKDKVAKIVQEDGQQTVTAEDVVKNHLVKIALKNPIFAIDDANIEIAELNRKKAGASWLGSINVGGNVNEFVIKNSPAASFFPKYNIGMSLPFDIFSKTKNEIKVADQNIVIAKSTKDQHALQIKTETLTRYETYKEKEELLTLQNVALANYLADYQSAQKSFEEGNVTIDKLNEMYKRYMDQRNTIVSIRKDLNVAIIQLEEMLGMPLEKAAPGLITK